MGKCSQHDMVIGLVFADVLSGGSVADDIGVSESILLDMERVAFIALLAEARTRERIEGMLKTGKPVRN